MQKDGLMYQTMINYSLVTKINKTLIAPWGVRQHMYLLLLLPFIILLKD